MVKLWEYESKEIAGRFLKKWFWWATHLRSKPIRNLPWSLIKHEDNITSWLDYQVNNVLAEGLNEKTKAVMRRVYRYRTFDTFGLVPLHNL